MAGNEATYVFVQRAPVLLARGRDNTTSLPVYTGADVQLPTAGTYALRDVAGTVLYSAVLSVVGDFPGSIATVLIPGASLPDTLYLGEGYSELWSLTVGGAVRPFRRDVVVSLFELHPPMPEADITEGEYPSLLDDIEGYNTTLAPYMEAAWKELIRALVRRGDFADIIVEPSDVYEWYRQLVLERVFRMLFKAQESVRFKELWDFHRLRAESEANGLRVKTDRARRGLADSLERTTPARSLHVNLSPRRRTFNPEW